MKTRENSDEFGRLFQSFSLPQQNAILECIKEISRMSPEELTALEASGFAEFRQRIKEAGSCSVCLS